MPDIRSGLRLALLADALIRLFIWSNAFIVTASAFTRFGLWPQSDPLRMTWDTAGLWGMRLSLFAVIYNLVYVAHLIVLRLLIPTPREGRYSVKPGQRPPMPVVWSCFIGALTKARLDPPFPAFLVLHVANLPPMCWLMNRLFGPRSQSCFYTEPYVLDPHLVEIGRNVVLGFNATLAGHYVERDVVVYKRTIIEDNVVVGGDVKILGGVHVKCGAVIGAGSVLLPNTIVGENEFWWGVPARKFRTLGPAETTAP